MVAPRLDRNGQAAAPVGVLVHCARQVLRLNHAEGVVKRKGGERGAGARHQRMGGVGDVVVVGQPAAGGGEAIGAQEAGEALDVLAAAPAGLGLLTLVEVADAAAPVDVAPAAPAQHRGRVMGAEAGERRLRIAAGRAETVLVALELGDGAAIEAGVGEALAEALRH